MSKWILLRGLTREARHWGNFRVNLQAVCPAAAIYAIDLPGNGSLNRQQSPARVEEMAEDCRRQLDDLGLAPPYFVLAMSLGAMVAVALATRYPEEIGGCVLINTSLRPFSPFYHRLRPCSYPSLIEILLRGGNSEHRERIILRLTSCDIDRPAIVADWASYRRQAPVSAANALRQIIAAVRYKAPSVKPLPPLLILASRQDRLVDPRCSRRLAACWNTSIVEHPTAGHDLPLDDARWVANKVGHWLQTLARKP